MPGLTHGFGWPDMLNNKALVFGCGLLLFIVACALLAPWISPHDPYFQDLTNRTVPPFWYEKGTWAHPLGTDQLGRDYLSRLIYGARISLLIGISVAIISGLIGTTMGMLAGYFGGKIDMLVSFFVTTRLSMPVILVASGDIARLGSTSWSNTSCSRSRPWPATCPLSPTRRMAAQKAAGVEDTVEGGDRGAAGGGGAHGQVAAQHVGLARGRHEVQERARRGLGFPGADDLGNMFQFKRDFEAARYATDRAFRQYDAADPANRLVASELEARWNRALTHEAEVEARIAAHAATLMSNWRSLNIDG